MSLEVRLGTMITGMCAEADAHTLRAVIIAAIPTSDKWYTSFDSHTDSDDKVFGSAKYRDVLDSIRIAVMSQSSTDIQAADEKVGDWPTGSIFYNLLLILYRKWRAYHPSGASDTDSTRYSPASSASSGDRDMGVHAKLEALRMASMR